MRGKEDTRDKRVCTKKKKESKKVFEKRENFQHVMEVEAMFTNFFIKYEYVAK